MPSIPAQGLTSRSKDANLRSKNQTMEKGLAVPPRFALVQQNLKLKPSRKHEVILHRQNIFFLQNYWKCLWGLNLGVFLKLVRLAVSCPLAELMTPILGQPLSLPWNIYWFISIPPPPAWFTSLPVTLPLCELIDADNRSRQPDLPRRSELIANARQPHRAKGERKDTIHLCPSYSYYSVFPSKPFIPVVHLQKRDPESQAQRLNWDSKISPPTLLTSTPNPKSVHPPTQTPVACTTPLLESIPVQKIRIVGLKEQMGKFNERTTSRGCHRTRPDNPSRAVAKEKEKQNYISINSKKHGKT